MSHGNSRTYKGSRNQSSLLFVSFKERMQRQQHENITGVWVEVEGLFASGELGVLHAFIQGRVHETKLMSVESASSIYLALNISFPLNYGLWISFLHACILREI